MITNEQLLELIDKNRLHHEFELVARRPMLAVFDENHCAGDFLGEEFFVDRYLYNPVKWTQEVTLEAMKVLDQHDPDWSAELEIHDPSEV